MKAAIFILMATLTAAGQLTPPKVASFISADSGATWTPLTGTGTTGQIGQPPAAALYVYNGTGWIPWAGASAGPPVTCVNTNNYACLNTANIFTAVQTVNSGASGNGILQTSSSTDGTYHRYANTSASLLNWKTGVAGSAFSLSGVYAIVDDTNSTGEFGIHSTGVGTGQILLGANMSIGFANNPDVRSAGGFNGLMSSDGSKWTFTLPLAAPNIGISNAITSATGGTGITSVTCATATCTNLRGTYTVVGGTATTGTIITLVWQTTTTAYVCQTSQNDTGVATAYLGLGHSVATATGMTVSAGISVIGTTFAVDYSCQP